MNDVNYFAIAAGTVFAVAFSALYYFILDKKVMAIRSAKSPNKTDVRTTLTLNRFLVDFVRTFVLGLVIGYAVSLLELTQPIQALVISFWLWLGFPVVTFVGLALHEKFPPALAVVHAGDWLAKILIFALVSVYWV